MKRLLMIALLCASPASADSNLPPARYANEQLPDARQEARAKALMEELRCLVCQGQSIADSDAELAGDMRALVRLLTTDMPEEMARPGNWMHDALEFRDQWRSKLLRTASWSPLD